MAKPSQVTEQKIISLYQELGTIAAVSKRVGLTDSTILRILIRHNIPRTSAQKKAITSVSPIVSLQDFLMTPRTLLEVCEQQECAPIQARLLLKSYKTDGTKFWHETPKVDVHAEIETDRAKLKEKAASASLKEKYDALIEREESLKEQLDFALQLKASFKPSIIKANPATKGGQATIVAQASDWHVGQRVDKQNVNYLNEFNPDIAERRIKNYFRNLLTLTRKERQAVQIKNLVLWLGGDMISNTIHEELLETNYMTPFQETDFAQNLIAGGLKLLAEDGEFDKITIVCNSGNHGRNTKKIRHASEVNNSHEHAMYWHLRSHFTQSLFDWQISNGYFQYVEIYGKLHRFHHGHNTRYQGGIGGLTIPLIKFIHRANQQRAAIHDWIGHYHQRFLHPDFTINGSLVGFDSYALSIGARPERPQQNFQLIDAKRGFTVSEPILLDEN